MRIEPNRRSTSLEMKGGQSPGEKECLLSAQETGKHVPERKISLALSMGSAGLYGAVAVAMGFANKGTLQVFGLANTLLFLQMCTVILVVGALRVSGYVYFPAVHRQRAWSLMPVTLLYVGNVAFALMSLQNLNIPMYNTLKRMTPVIVLVTKAVQTKQAPPQLITASVLLIVSGCIVAGLGDFSFDIKGYVCALSSCMLQASYLLLVEKSGAEKGIGSTELLYYNALLSLPFILGVMAVSGEAPLVAGTVAKATSQLGSVGLVSTLALFSLSGMLLNYSLFLCTMCNSALTTTIVGVLKGVISTLLGFFLLGGVEVHTMNVLGIAINALGGTWYTVIKYQQRQKHTQEQSSAHS